MRRQTKKLLLTLLLSAALVSTNMQFVSAQEETLSDGEETSDSKSSDESSSQDAGEAESDSDTSQAESTGSTEQTESTTPAENTNQTEGSAPAENTNQTESSAPAENTNQTESSAPAENTAPTDTNTGNTDGGNTQTPVTDTDNAADGNEAGSGTEQEGGTGQDAENPDTLTGEEGAADDTAAADPTENGQPEQIFVNKNGEEVKPSDLVGVDYNTIAESYDGETNAVKQYVVSDQVPAGTIISSYVDENGNLVMQISQGAPASTVEEPEEDKTLLEEVAEAVEYALGSTSGSSSSAPPVDGSFSGWDDVPASYEFNWNKPDAWVDGTHYTDTNSTDVRHEMKLYSDGENVYLRVVYAREFCNGQVANGNDFQFWIDKNQMAAYQVEWPDGTSLSNSNAAPGIYQVDVRHRDSSWSYVLTDGAVAYYRVNDGNLNNELELRIPLSEFVKQNPNINLDNYSMISFFTPNLMQDHISTAGSPTGAEPFAAAAFLFVPTSYIWLKKKGEKEDMAFA